MRSFWKRLPDHYDYEAARTCITCGHQFNGKFCSRCGEKVIEPYDRSIRHFLDHLFNALTFIDGKFYRSLRTMLLHPGQMASDQVQGKRQPYMKPVAFFFVGNFLYFLFPIFQTFNTTLYWQMHGMPYSDYTKAVVEAHLATAGLTIEAFTPSYEAASTNWAKLILIALAPLAFPFVVLINYNRKHYLSDHFLFTMEYSTFLVFVPTWLYSLLIYAVAQAGDWVGLDLRTVFDDRNSVLMAALLLGYFLYRGHRHFYQQPWWRALAGTVLMLVSMYLIIHGYRFLLFQFSMWSAG